MLNHFEIKLSPDAWIRAALAAWMWTFISANLSAQSNYADPYTFRTFAVNVDPVGFFTPGGYPNPWGLAVDAAGNLYVADQGENTIRRITPAGVSTILAGTPGVRGTADGPGTSALFWGPEGVAVDSAGNVLVGDTINNTIRRITPDGLVTTLAGAGPFLLLYADGTGSNAEFYYPCEMAVDSSGNAFTVDWGNVCVRKITPAGAVTTLAGKAGNPGSADGTGSAASFALGPEGMTIDPSGNLFVTDSTNNTVRKVTPGGAVTTVAGQAGSIGTADGPGSSARFNYPIGVAADSTGNVFIGDSSNYTVRKIDPNDGVTTVAGSPGAIGTSEGTGAAAQFNYPAGLAINAAGNLFVAEPYANQIAVGYSAKSGTPLASAPISRSVYTPYAFTTIAGGGRYGSSDGPVSSALFNNAASVASDPAGNLYVADTNNFTIRKISAAGIVNTLAGSTGVSGWRDGQGRSALFYYPAAIALDGRGNVYVADLDNTIRMITSDGLVTTLAGTAGVVGSADGKGAAASFNRPRGLAADGNGNVFVADSPNQTIREIAPDGTVTTLAGLASTLQDFLEGGAGSADGTGSVARFDYPAGISIDGSGNLYVADEENNTIRKITSAGVVTTLAGTAGYSNYGTTDATGALAKFYYPAGTAVDGSGNVYVADSYNDEIRKITPGGTVSTVATKVGFSDPSGLAAAGRLMGPNSVTVDSAGNLYVACWGGNGIRKIAPNGTLSLLAGTTGLSSASDGVGAAAQFYDPAGVTVDSGGNLYVADTGNHTVRKIAAGGIVTTFAGNPGSAGSADGAGASAGFEAPAGLAVDSSGNLYVADEAASTIRKVTPDGNVTTLAGSPGVTGSTDGVGSAARFNCPAALAVGSDGTVYVADEVNSTIRKITGAGSVTTLAGTPGHVGNSDGTGPQASFLNPAGIAVDGSGNLYVTDLGNSTIRKITSSGIVTTLAGTAGMAGFNDGTGPAASFTYPRGIAVDLAGNLYVSDGGNHTIRMITPAGVVTTLGGSPGISGVADGQGQAARFFTPVGVAVDGAGNLFVADSGNRTIRKGVIQAPSITGQPSSITVATGSTATFNIAASGSPVPTYQWMFNGSPISGATSSTLVISGSSSANEGSYTCAATNGSGSVTSSAGVLTVEDTTTPGHLINIAARSFVGTGGNVLIAGFVVQGSSALPVLVRSSGPALSADGVSGVLSDPELQLYSGSSNFATNAGWGGNALITSTAAAVGASPWNNPSSLDSALLESLNPGAYTGITSGSSGDSGVALAEVYDATPSGTFTSTSPHLINIAARAFVGTGGNVLIAGFVIGGSTSKTVLIRASGPALASDGVSGVLSDPQVQLYSGSSVIASNAGWGGNAQIVSVANSVGASAWSNPSSLDSALLVTLPPGAYTAIISGVGGDSGVALAEVYDVP